MRELLIIRHAIAYERDARQWPNDDDRPLTRKGMRRFRRAARGIAALTQPPDEMLSSPLVRTRQTARILQRRANFPRARMFRELRPDVSTSELVAALRNCAANRIAIVGHEPCLSKLLGALLGGQHSTAMFAMKKGGFAWLSFERGKARLLAFVPPRVLRDVR